MVEIFNWRPHSWTVGIGPQEQYLWVWWQVVQTRDWDGPGLQTSTWLLIMPTFLWLKLMIKFWKLQNFYSKIVTKLKCLKDFLITDRNQYLLTSSCHPASVTNNIPFSLALRLVRICSEVESRDKGLMELKQITLIHLCNCARTFLYF